MVKKKFQDCCGYEMIFSDPDPTFIVSDPDPDKDSVSDPAKCVGQLPPRERWAANWHFILEKLRRD
jgi:hypothetical protein